MPRYTVTISRTELISFEIEAENPQEAEENYLYGDEVYSETTATEIDSIELVEGVG